MKGKIVYCLGGMSGQDYVIQELGGAGTIMILSEKTDTSFTTTIPGTYLEASAVGKSIEIYINSTKYVSYTSIYASAKLIARVMKFNNSGMLKL